MLALLMKHIIHEHYASLISPILNCKCSNKNIKCTQNSLSQAEKPILLKLKSACQSLIILRSAKLNGQKMCSSL